MALTAKEDKTLARLLSHMKVVRDEWPSVAYMKQALINDDDAMFLEAWNELSKQQRTLLWVAPLNGGIWETKERTTIRRWLNEQRFSQSEALPRAATQAPESTTVARGVNTYD